MKTVKLSKEKAEEKGIYNSKKHLSYILYLDCNNLYGHSLSQHLPTGDLKYEDESLFNKENFFNLSDKGDKGYTFIVDIEIPQKIHDKIKDYSTLPEHYIPNFEEP